MEGQTKLVDAYGREYCAVRQTFCSSLPHPNCEHHAPGLRVEKRSAEAGLVQFDL